ncbi:MAG TPA: twin-arginine translocation signal domain-containing protein, partial [Kiritimatiellia bacterium]|nr:twin-arginine translocation signal domain-containing protein [Kiritimatiellia bacterium]
MSMNRRGFLKNAAWAGGAVGVGAWSGCMSSSGISARKGGSMAGFRCEPMATVRVGVIGVGHRGPGAVRRLSSIPGV